MLLARQFHIIAVLVLCNIFNEVAAHVQTCGASEYSIFGMTLERHIFQTIAVSLGTECVQACNNDVRCQSFNYVISQDMCELSNRTKEARPEDFVPNFDRYYYGLVKQRVPLGSIPELPAESCKEIKASETALAVSGMYWVDSIIPGKTVLTHCNMETEDVDECSSSNSVCHADAICQNTAGSFTCACKAGYSGDGLTCADVDECSQGSHDCLLSLASCTNTAGSYSCACNSGYIGDGKTSCEFAPECQKYTTLTSADRKTSYATVSKKCDNSLGPGWFRFQGAAGTRLPTSCPPTNMCDTHATGWMNGAHPTKAHGKVTRQVCFHWSSNCCYWSTNIRVINCGSYYVYYLSGTPYSCYLRYCGTD